MWKSSQNLVTERPAVSCIVWLGDAHVLRGIHRRKCFLDLVPSLSIIICLPCGQVDDPARGKLFDLGTNFVGRANVEVWGRAWRIEADEDVDDVGDDLVSHHGPANAFLIANSLHLDVDCARLALCE